MAMSLWSWTPKRELLRFPMQGRAVGLKALIAVFSGA